MVIVVGLMTPPDGAAVEDVEESTKMIVPLLKNLEILHNCQHHHLLVVVVHDVVHHILPPRLSTKPLTVATVCADVPTISYASYRCQCPEV